MIILLKHGKANSERSRGFTLIEVMVAVIILAIGILAIGSMQISAIRSNSGAHTITELKGWATDEYEGILSDPLGYDQNNNLISGTHQLQLPPGYALTWQVTDDDIVQNTKTIAMRIEAQRSGVTRTVRFDYVM